MEPEGGAELPTDDHGLWGRVQLQGGSICLGQVNWIFEHILLLISVIATLKMHLPNIQVPGTRPFGEQVRRDDGGILPRVHGHVQARCWPSTLRGRR